MQTVKEALRLVRKSGPIYGQVLVREDVTWLKQIKAEVVRRLEQYRNPETAEAPWTVQREDGETFLHIY